MNRVDKSGNIDGIKLQSYLSRCGVGSRRYCESLIASGCISVNGIKVMKLGIRVKEDDIITVNGIKVEPIRNKIYLAINKPRGYLCANYDSYGRPLVVDLFDGKYTTKGENRVYHIGRLDMDSEGLILYTNDGVFSNIVMHPSNEIEKEYIVETGNIIKKSILEEYSRGIELNDGSYTLSSYQFINRKKVRLVLNEGKNREIRRVFKHFGIVIESLIRVRIGIITLSNLKPGEYRHLTHREIEWFLR